MKPLELALSLSLSSNLLALHFFPVYLGRRRKFAGARQSDSEGGMNIYPTCGDGWTDGRANGRAAGGGV